MNPRIQSERNEARAASFAKAKRERADQPKPPTPDLPKRGFEGMVVLHLNSEAPKIGSGVRLCTASVGSRWVRLRSASGRRCKIAREEFERVFRSIYRVGVAE